MVSSRFFKCSMSAKIIKCMLDAVGVLIGEGYLNNCVGFFCDGWLQNMQSNLAKTNQN